MEYRGTSVPRRPPPRPEPSWPTVIATTLRLWLERHPVVVGSKTIRIRLPASRAQAERRESMTRGKRVAAFALVAGLLVTGTGAAGLTRARHHAAAQPERAAQPGSVAAIPAPVGPIAGVAPAQDARVPAPVALTIPAAGVQASLTRLGLTAAGELQVPASTAVAGWYTGSPRPGAIGPAVIAGHVDSRVGPGVFFHLSQLRPGDRVYVRRADGTLAVFRVTAVQMYVKDSFPTLAVYGPAPDPELRLITCGGTFDPSKRSYLSNTVVYAVETS
jgi:LPXTG-site transpeptidase (sortase) family protein